LDYVCGFIDGLEKETKAANIAKGKVKDVMAILTFISAKIPDIKF